MEVVSTFPGPSSHGSTSGLMMDKDKDTQLTQASVIHASVVYNIMIILLLLS